MTIFPDFVIFSSVFVVVDWVNWSIKFIERDREREKIGQKMEGAKTGFNPVSWVTRSNLVLRGFDRVNHLRFFDLAWRPTWPVPRLTGSTGRSGPSLKTLLYCSLLYLLYN